MKGQANNETSVGGEGMEEEVGTGGGEGGLARKDAAVKPCKKQCYRFGTDSCLHIKVAGGRRRKTTWGVDVCSSGKFCKRFISSKRQFEF